MIHIFLSYRRTDTADATGRLYDNLRMKFGEELVFRDVYNIAVGIDWHEHIIETLKESDVVLAIIGPTWLAATDTKGRRRLDDPEDAVREELDLAIELSVPIIPVLVGTATMPARDDFPDSLKPLSRLNAARLRDTDFDHDFERLFQAIQKYARQKVVSIATPRSVSSKPTPTPSPVVTTPTPESVPTKPTPIVSPSSAPADLTSDGVTPALTPQRLTIREKSAAEIVGNLKGVTPSYRFYERVKELYFGRWTREPGWQATVDDLPSELPGGNWFCSLREVGSGTSIMASAVHDISMLRPGDSVTVIGKIGFVSQIGSVNLENATLRGDNVPSP